MKKPKITESPKDSGPDKAYADRSWKDTNWRWTNNDGWVDLTNTTVIGGDTWVDYKKDDSPASASASSAKWTRPVHDVAMSPNPAEPKRFKAWNVDEEAMKALTPEDRSAYLLQMEADHKACGPENN